MSGSPYNDDGQPVRMRPGWRALVRQQGRPPKPDLTPAERAAIVGLGNRLAAAKVSELRGAMVASISAAEANRRRVSHDWIRVQRQKIGAAENSGVAGAVRPAGNSLDTTATGPRMGCAVPPGSSDAEIKAAAKAAAEARAAGRSDSPAVVAGAQPLEPVRPVGAGVVAKGGGE